MLSYVNEKRSEWLFISYAQAGRLSFIGVKGETNMSAGVSITVSYIMKTTKSETHEITWLIGTRRQKMHRKCGSLNFSELIYRRNKNALYFKMMCQSCHKNIKQHNCFQH